MDVSVGIAKAPHFSLLFDLNLEACWAALQKTAHEHSLKIYSGTVISKHICPADTVAQQSLQAASCNPGTQELSLRS